jgi:hypothetical protein
LKVALGTLKEKGDELVAFLEPRVGAKPTRSGDSIEIEDGGLREGVKPRHVKTYIKRFLYMNGVRKKYRVFVAGKELTIEEIEAGEEEEKKEPAEKPEEAPVEEPKPEEAEEKAPEAAEEAQEKAKPKKAAVKKPRAKKKKEKA